MELVKLISNENPFGPPPKALDAIRKYAQSVNYYPKFVPQTLKEKLAAKYHVSPENITVSAGSYELINLITRFLVNRDEEILTFDNTFIAYSYSAKRNSRKCSTVQMTGPECNLNDLIPLCGDKTKAIFIANPNNPTGTIVTHDSLQKLLKEISSHILVVVDEAYFEYVTDESYPNSVQIQKDYPNLVILRTFSKIYGLAGIRIGYGIASREISEVLEKNRLLRSVNALAEKAAEAALDDVEYIEQSAAHNDRERAILYEELSRLGYNVNPSQANFLYFSFPDNERKAKVYRHLSDHGFLVCDMEFFGKKNALRITIGNSDANHRVIQCLGKLVSREKTAEAV